MKLILINSSSDDMSYLSNQVVVPAYGTLDVASSYWFALYTDISFIRDIRLNNIGVNDGDKSMFGVDAETYLEQINSFNYNNKDTDGALIVRTKAAKKGWSFWALPIEITTSTLDGSLYCKNYAGDNISGVTCKIYDNNDTEITTAGPLNANLATCTKTVLDFEPTFDYELVGGLLRLSGSVNYDIRLWIIGAPDIASQYGGSREFASGINLKFMPANGVFEVDGRVTKFISYNAVTHSNKLRLLLRHPAGATANMQFIIHMYRQ